jgi:hypothetical protein
MKQTFGARIAGPCSLKAAVIAGAPDVNHSRGPFRFGITLRSDVFCLRGGFAGAAQARIASVVRCWFGELEHHLCSTRSFDVVYFPS